MTHLFTLDTKGNVSDTKGNHVATLSDDSNILDFLAGVRAAFDAIGQEIKGEIIREADIWAWEAAAVARTKGPMLHLPTERHPRPVKSPPFLGRRSI